MSGYFPYSRIWCCCLVRPTLVLPPTDAGLTDAVVVEDEATAKGGVIPRQLMDQMDTAADEGADDDERRFAQNAINLMTSGRREQNPANNYPILCIHSLPTV